MAEHTLYLCYFGLREPLVQTQVLPYLRELMKDGVKVSLLTFETDLSKQPEQAELERGKLAAEGISWHQLAYHKNPSAPVTVYDILCGAMFARRLARKEKIDVFHGRSHLPTLMGWLARKFLRRKPKLLFDIRGFFPEEYVDAGIWKKDSAVFRVTKRVERLLLRDADGFVVLTEKARAILFPESKTTDLDRRGRPVEVIPCCADLKKFAAVGSDAREAIRRRLSIGDRRVIVYVGSFGGFYMTKEMADFYAVARRRNPDTFALILTQSSPLMIEPLLRAGGYTEADYFIRKVSPSEIPHFLSAADIALSFIKPAYSKTASSPTKNAEYLAAGLPLIANSLIGDTAEEIEFDRVGVIINDFSDESFTSALEKMQVLSESADLPKNCRRSAEVRFDLEKIGGVKYRSLYKRLLAKRTSESSAE